MCIYHVIRIYPYIDR